MSESKAIYMLGGNGFYVLTSNSNDDKSTQPPIT